MFTAVPFSGGCLVNQITESTRLKLTLFLLILTLLGFLIWFNHAAAQALVQRFQTVVHVCLRRGGIAAMAHIDLAQLRLPWNAAEVNRKPTRQ